jgi:2-C-methyl-D-erythritol 4-phosphate cytidylyltransferase/2-C-methyl-D-erythritol 2,4-cyclodiphosphate synthase
MEKSVKSTILSTFHVLIAAAGSGKRFGGELPKQYRQIGGKPLIRHTIDSFLRTPGIASLRVIIDPEHNDLYREAVSGLDLPEPITGGSERKDSIINGLKAFSNLSHKDIILIHDGARPLVRPADIHNIVHILQDHPAACLATPVADTLRRQASNDEAADPVDRSGLWAMQTPQGFHYGVIRDAHDKAPKNKNYTDDTQMVSDLGIPVKLVQGSRTNIKVTTPEDLEIVAAFLERTESRIGIGFDVHAFSKESGPVRLCGIDVPHANKLEGHSDADVALHAITDALLGSIGQGDIGRHFPPSDMKYKNMDSAIFLKRAVELVLTANGKIANIDLTIICESPKITPHAEKMIARVAEICGIDKSRVSVKATTTEKLGFTGRGEGIASQAIASVTLPREF